MLEEWINRAGDGHKGWKIAEETTATIRPIRACSMGCFKPSKEDEDEKVRREANKKIEKQLQKDKQLYRATHRLLLLG